MRTLSTWPLLAAALLLPAAPVARAAQEQPDWPCVQRLVPALEPGQMWSGPPLDGVAGRPLPPGLEERAGKLADLDLAPEALEAEVEAFAEGLPAAERAQTLTLLFRTALDQLNTSRSDLIAGIKRYARRQHALAERITAETRELEAARKESADPARVQDLQTAHDWDTRVFTDRQRQLRLVCDQPVRLEQRAFALARAIQGHLP
jgi:hypothetical protein